MTPPFDFQPILVGESIVLRPLRVDDRAAITSAASDPAIWELHPARDRYLPEVFAAYFNERFGLARTLVVEDVASRELVGWSSYGKVDIERNEVEIGWTFLVRSRWGGPTNREMKRLMIDHAFRFVDGVVFRIGANNLRSRRAMEKLGARLRDETEVLPSATGPVTYAAYEFRRPSHGSGFEFHV
jgi:N-acetyltransferase